MNCFSALVLFCLRALMPRTLVLALALLSSWGGLHAGQLQFENATVFTTIDGKVSRDIVTLPFRWDLQYPGLAGSAVLEFEFMADQLPQSPIGLYFPKLGSAYVVSLNGVVIGRDGDLLVSGGQDTGKAPRLMPVNSELIKPHNILRIQLRADSGRKAGVSAVLIDEWGKVSALFDEYRLWRVGVPAAIAAAHACLAVLSVLLWWWSGRGRLDGAGPQPIFLFSAVALFCWALRLTDSIWETPPLPWPLWGAVPVLGLGVWGCCCAHVCMVVAKWDDRPWANAVRLWLVAILLSGLVFVPWGLIGAHPALLTIWYAVLGLTLLAFSVGLAKHSMGSGGNAGGRLLSGAVLLSACIGLLDLLRMRTHAGVADVAWLYYASIVFGLILAITTFQYARTNRQVSPKALQAA